MARGNRVFTPGAPKSVRVSAWLRGLACHIERLLPCPPASRLNSFRLRDDARPPESYRHCVLYAKVLRNCSSIERLWEMILGAWQGPKPGRNCCTSDGNSLESPAFAQCVLSLDSEPEILRSPHHTLCIGGASNTSLTDSASPAATRSAFGTMVKSASVRPATKFKGCQADISRSQITSRISRT